MRYASAALVSALFDYAEQLGVSPSEVANPGVIALVRGRNSGRVPGKLMLELLERYAAAFDDPLFGLRYGQQVDLKIYGPISLLWRYAPTVRYSNRITTRILHLQHEGVAVMLREQDDGTSALIYRVDTSLSAKRRHFVESGVSFMLRLCRLIIGPGWSPQRVVFTHNPAADVAQYTDILNAPVKFGASEDGLAVVTSDLDRRSTETNVEILTFVERSLLQVAEQDPLPFRERLEQVVDDLLAIGQPQLAATAGVMAMSSRTLQRHLSDENTSFRAVVKARRRRVIEDLRQRSSSPSLALLAERTAFSEASAVSRFLRNCG